jgi:maltose alpha-D-glucosyltransferase / alpha-amylase
VKTADSAAPLSWSSAVDATARGPLAEALLSFARDQRWFRGKARAPRGATLFDVVTLAAGDVPSLLVLLEVSYAAGEPELYAVPIARGRKGDVVDGLREGRAAEALLALVAGASVGRGESGELRGHVVAGHDLLGEARRATARAASVEQSNSTVTFGDRALLKLYRQPMAGPNPELELGSFLGAHPRRPPVPRVLGALIHRDATGVERSLAIVHELVANEGDAWVLATRELRGFFERVSEAPPPGDDGAARIGPFRELARTLGRRTGELHLALADVPAGPETTALAPEPLTAEDRFAAARGVESMLARVLETLATRREGLAALDVTVRRLLDDTSHERRQLAGLLARYRETPIAVCKTRIHGDLHLGQVLATGNDFVIIDFEGEPSRPVDERRAKGSPLRDVVGLLRSFDYAPEAVLRELTTSGYARPPRLEPWAALWKQEVSRMFQESYFETVAGAPFLPEDDEHLALMLELHTLERVVYEISYELANRPDWVEIPLRGLVALLGPGASTWGRS